MTLQSFFTKTIVSIGVSAVIVAAVGYALQFPTGGPQATYEDYFSKIKTLCPSDRPLRAGYDANFDPICVPQKDFNTPACTPNTSCAATTCAGQTCSDGCGGTVNGTKKDGACSSGTWQGGGMVIGVDVPRIECAPGATCSPIGATCRNIYPYSGPNVRIYNFICQ